MENNIQNKTNFFGLYINQKVFYDGADFKADWRDALRERWIFGIHLKLAPVSLIKDEDSIHIAVLAGWGTGSHNWTTMIREGKLIAIEGRDSTCDEIGLKEFTAISDYLRSKGYALPYMGLSVEEQVSRGWVKLVGIPEGLYIDKNTLK